MMTTVFASGAVMLSTDGAAALARADSLSQRCARLLEVLALHLVDINLRALDVAIDD